MARYNLSSFVHFGIPGLSGALVAIAMNAAGAIASPVSCGDLAIDPDSVPLDDYPVTSLLQTQSLVVPAGGDPVVEVKVAQPLTLSPLDQYVCGTDYFADLTAGTATVTFNRMGSYYVQVKRQSSATEGHVALVEMREHGGGCVRGPAREIVCKAGDIVLVSSTLGFAHNWGASGTVVNGIAQARTEICNAYAANNNMPVQLTIDAHGSPGSITLGNDTITKQNLATFIDPDGAGGPDPTLKGKVEKITLFVCSVAGGNAGDMFLTCMGQDLCTTVTGYTGTVTDTPPGQMQKWYACGVGRTREQPGIPTMTEWSLIILAGGMVAYGAYLVRRQPAAAAG